MRPLALILFWPCVAFAQGTAADYERAAKLPGQAAALVRNARVEPAWSVDDAKFTYQRTGDDGKPQFVEVTAADGSRRTIAEKEIPKPPAPERGPRRRGPRSSFSPDGHYSAIVEAHNVVLHAPNVPKVLLSTDGTAEHPYTNQFFWSPDSKKLVAIRTKQGGARNVTLVESSPRNQLQPKSSAYFYLKPGDEIPLPKPVLFDVAAKALIPVSDALFPTPWDVSYEHWLPDSSCFLFAYNQRGHAIMRVIALDATTGAATAIVNEECATFFDYANKLYLNYLDDRDELVWMSERSGWNHLYRVNVRTGKTDAITKGNWLVRRVERLDEDELLIATMGRDPKQDPYHVHFAKVKLDGTGFTPLTEGDGTHALQWSPGRKFFLDTTSRVDQLPTTELRSAGGKRIGVVETATAPGLTELVPLPERFTAKGRDGTTDIHGYIVRPSNFDAAKTYRVIESIYAGPHDQHVPKRFAATQYEQRMAELGFVVVKIDGMGTNWRSKAFHDVCWKNLGDGGFPDRIAWIRAAAKAHPEFDIAKGVGIFGGSAGGQSAMRGMTEHPDFYAVGVADCGCHDNRMDKIWWNELWMSWPLGPHYAEQSNVTNAHKLKGKLLLVVGELDRNVDPASTLQVVNALVKANRDFEMLLIPGGGHGVAESAYGSRRRADFFVRNLLGVEPRR